MVFPVSTWGRGGRRAISTLVQAVQDYGFSQKTVADHLGLHDLTISRIVARSRPEYQGPRTDGPYFKRKSWYTLIRSLFLGVQVVLLARDMSRVLTKKDAREYLKRWRLVNEVLDEELRTMPIEVKFQKMDAAYRMAVELGVLPRMKALKQNTEKEVRRRWLRLKKSLR